MSGEEKVLPSPNDTEKKKETKAPSPKPEVKKGDSGGRVPRGPVLQGDREIMDHPFGRPIFIKDPTFFDEIFIPEIWDNSFDTFVIIKLMAILLFILLGVIGELVKYPLGIMEVFFMTLGAVIFSVVRELRQRFLEGRRKHRIKMRYINSDDYFRKFLSECDGKRVYLPDEPGVDFVEMADAIYQDKVRQHTSVTRPDGPAGNKPRKRVIHVKVGRSAFKSYLANRSLSIPFSAKRPHVLVSIGESEPVSGLLDSGANSCFISRSYLLNLESISKKKFPRLETDFKIHGLNSVEKGATVVLLDILIDEKVPVKDVPFIVCNMDTDVLLGLNIIRSCRISTTWDHKQEVKLTFERHGVSGSLRVIHDRDTSIRTVSCHRVTLQPGTVTNVSLETIEAHRHRVKGFQGKQILLEDAPDMVSPNEKGFEVVPTLTRIKRGRLNGCVLNNSDIPMVLEKGVALGRCKVVEEEYMSTDRLKVQELIEARDALDKLEWFEPQGCVCEASLGGNIIQLVDSSLYSSIRLSPLDQEECLEQPKKGYNIS